MKAIAIVLLLSSDHYLASLEEIQKLLAANQIALAQEKARALAPMDVDDFHADAALLQQIATTQQRDLSLQERLKVTIDELRHASTTDVAAADRNLLRRVAEEQKVPELAAGGELTIEA